MTDFDIDAAQQLCDNATKGPWKYPHKHWPGVVTSPHGCLWTSSRGGGEINDESDATFIAAARTLLPDALTEIRRLRAQVQRVEALCDQSDAATGEFSWLGLDSESVRAALGASDE